MSLTIPPIFRFESGQLWYRDWCWGDDAFARARMERQAQHFEGDRAWCADLAAECRQALAEFDTFHMEPAHA